MQLLVVCPNLAVDRILLVDNFSPAKVQRSRSVITQPGGKGSNVARVFHQLGGQVVLVGFVGTGNRQRVEAPLRRLGIQVDAVPAFEGDGRTCTIVCDPNSQSHPTVINEESPAIEEGAARRLLAKARTWMPRVDAVLTTGSLSTGLPDDFYAQILDESRRRRKVTAIDAAGSALRAGLCARPAFIKPNAEEFFQLVHSSNTSTLVLPEHTAITCGKAGAVVIHHGRCFYAAPPRVFDTNPIGAGDTFAAAYLTRLLDGFGADECLRFGVAAAASDAATLRPGEIDVAQLQSLVAQVEVRFS